MRAVFLVVLLILTYSAATSEAFNSTEIAAKQEKETPVLNVSNANSTEPLITAVKREKAKNKCPRGFKMYERSPTARNKFTKQWCLKVVENEDVYDRPTARAVCLDYDAVITNVDNQKELDDVNALIRKNNKRVAVDGVFNPKCRGFSDWRMRKFGGLCAKEKELFVLEDDHTDPSFILQKWIGEPPTVSDKYKEDGTEIFTIGECLSLNNLIAMGNQGNLKDFLCGEKPDKQSGEVDFFGVLCGCPPV